MPIICHCTDGEGATELRREHLDAHLRYIETILDRICVAGPLRVEPTDEPGASCFIYATDDPAEALRMLHGDPYYQAGVWSKIESHHMNAVAGQWVGGKHW